MHTPEQPNSDTPTEGITRRAALGRLGAGAAGSMLAMSCGALSSRSVNDEVHDLPHSAWHALVNDRFTVEDTPFHDGVGDDTVLTLREATDLAFENDAHRPEEIDRDAALSLLFTVDGAAPLPNATYTIRHSDLGDFHLFLHEVPRDEYPDTRVYEAILN